MSVDLPHWYIPISPKSRMNIRTSDILADRLRRRTEASLSAAEEGVRTKRGIGVGSLTVRSEARRESWGAVKVAR